MITTVTMNASLDKPYRVGRLRDGSVMRVSEVSNTAGGKGLNVAKVAALLGESVAATGFLGGFNGAYVRSLLAGSGVEDAFVESGVETRSCINVIDDETGASTEFLEPGPAVAPERYEAFLGRYRALVAKSDAVTISGSLPSDAPEGFYGRLVAIAREAGVPVILDTSGRILREGVAARPTLVKPNREELAALTGKEPAGEKEIVAAMRGLLGGGLPSIAVSLGAEGCLFACAEGVFRGSVPEVRAVNPVGCGDSMVAAFAVGLARKMPPEETFRLALAVSAASAMDAKTGCFDKDDLATLSARVTTETIGHT
jgi:tagatose 6-phosphate kinase